MSDEWENASIAAGDSLAAWKGLAAGWHVAMTRAERERDKAREDLARMMPDETSVLIPVSALSMVGERAEAAEAEVERLREALSFYANPDRWAGAAEVIWQDSGTRARAALSPREASER